MTSEIEIFEIVISKLESAGIPYMVTGSVAANFFSTPRMTRDLDIVIEVGEKEVKKLVSIFSEDFYIDNGAIREAIRKKKTFNIIHNDGIVKIDFIVRKGDEYHKIEFARRRKVAWGKKNVFIATPEDIIISKLYWAKDSFSEIQLKDVKNLFKSVENLEIEYIKKWVKELGLEKIYREVKK